MSKNLSDALFAAASEMVSEAEKLRVNVERYHHESLAVQRCLGKILTHTLSLQSARSPGWFHCLCEEYEGAISPGIVLEDARKILDFFQKMGIESQGYYARAIRGEVQMPYSCFNVSKLIYELTHPPVVSDPSEGLATEDR